MEHGHADRLIFIKISFICQFAIFLMMTIFLVLHLCHSAAGEAANCLVDDSSVNHLMPVKCFKFFHIQHQLNGLS